MRGTSSATPKGSAGAEANRQGTTEGSACGAAGYDSAEESACGAAGYDSAERSAAHGSILNREQVEYRYRAVDWSNSTDEDVGRASAGRAAPKESENQGELRSGI